MGDSNPLRRKYDPGVDERIILTWALNRLLEVNSVERCL
jgi:hypothetical protein